jgi:hypothetical protein
MSQQVVYSALSAVFNLAFAAVPALPLLGKKWPVAMERSANRLSALTITPPICHTGAPAVGKTNP